MLKIVEYINKNGIDSVEKAFKLKVKEILTTFNF